MHGQIGNEWSQLTSQEEGIAQGSILEPLSFIVPVNNLAYKRITYTIQYADDTVLVVSDANIDTMRSKVDVPVNLSTIDLV